MARAAAIGHTATSLRRIFEASLKLQTRSAANLASVSLYAMTTSSLSSVHVRLKLGGISNRST
ncbi:hypothetical protein M3J09_000835 [Ascochyta lentis]